MMNRLFIRGALLLSCSLLAACSSTPKNQDVAVKQEIIKPDAAVWLSEKESLLRDSIKGLRLSTLLTQIVQVCCYLQL